MSQSQADDQLARYLAHVEQVGEDLYLSWAAWLESVGEQDTTTGQAELVYRLYEVQMANGQRFYVSADSPSEACAIANMSMTHTAAVDAVVAP